MGKTRILLVMGTRPEAIKMAPVISQCRRQADRLETIVCFTGQHREMLRQVADYFGIEADVDLNLMAAGHSLADFTARCLAALDQVIEKTTPAWLVAQGDTTTVMVAALAAFYRNVPSGAARPQVIRPTSCLDHPFPGQAGSPVRLGIIVSVTGRLQFDHRSVTV